MNNNTILVSQPDLGAAEVAEVQAALESHWVGTGPRTEAFEKTLAEFLGVRHVIATSSGTAALHLSLASLDRDARNEVIVPSLTFVASVQAILMAGYRPVFAEVDPETLTVDCKDVERLLNTRTRAILPVHFAGYPCDLTRLGQLAARAGVALVEDAAHAFGSNCNGLPIGRHGTLVCFSFSSNKNLTCGEGGGVATASDELAVRLSKLRFLGISRDTWSRLSQDRPWEYAVDRAGFRYHMSDINAAIGLTQFRRLDEFASKRRWIAARYDAALRNWPGMAPVRRDLEHTIPNLYVLRVTDGRRDALYAHLRQAGIVCGVHYTPNHRQPAFRAHSRKLPVTERLADEVLTLPLHTRLTEADVARVLEVIRSFQQRTVAASPAPALMRA